METIKEMRERHTREILDLQNSCNHPDVTDWLPYMWAYCQVCNKEIESRSKVHP
jgi:hypothetical protein